MALSPPRPRKAQGATVRAVHAPAPVGGWNSVDGASTMPASDCVYLYNMIPSQRGLRVRAGWQVYETGIGERTGSDLAFALCTNLGVETPKYEIRTLIAFTGSDEKRRNDRLFACTANGIYDITDPYTDPECVYVFNSVTARSGRGVGTAFSNAAGHFYAYCDEENGFIIYSENYGWSTVEEAAQVAWAAGTTYAVGAIVANGGLSYICTVNGVSGSTGPTGSSSSITDGGCTWAFYPTVSGVDPARFRHVTSWKNRLFFTVNESATAYYLDVNAVLGTASPFYFGPRFKYGGALVGLWSWTLDGGAGVDDHLVGISTSGDVVVYAGTDPSDSTKIGLKGVWMVGDVPTGRRIASDFGGDLFILSAQGCVPLSKLVTGGIVNDPTIFVTQKITNLFNTLMQDRRNLHGWELRVHPTDNTLVIVVPSTKENAVEQLVMGFATKGWARHRGIPMNCTEVWHGRLYFGMKDGRVGVNTGWVDEMSRDGTEFTEIDWSLLTSYQHLKSLNKKRVQMLRPSFITAGSTPRYDAVAKYDFDIYEVPDVIGIPGGELAFGLGGTLGAAEWSRDPNTWDLAVWDTAIWGTGYGTANRVHGANGMGTAIAVAVRGASRAETTLIGIDVMYDEGGLL